MMKLSDVAIAGASLLLVALTAWMVWQVRGAARPLPVAAAPQRIVATPPVAVAPAPLPAAAPLPAPAVAQLSSIEVCGLGQLALPVPEREAEAAIAAAVLGPIGLRASERLVATLDASGDEHERALGHFIAGRRDALAAQAMYTRDLRVYRLAIADCHQPSDDSPHCAALSNEQWARLDSDNAVAWLRLAEDAAQRGDSAALAEALFRASHAPRADADGSAARLMQRADVARLPTVERLALSTLLINRWAALPSPALQAPWHYCQDAASEPNRQQLCSDVAALLVERDTSLPGFVGGVRLATPAGWSEQRLRQLADERDALQWAAQRSTGEAPQFSCDWWRSRERLTVDLAARGELNTLRRLVTDSQRSSAELANAWRASRSRAGAVAVTTAREPETR